MVLLLDCSFSQSCSWKGGFALTEDKVIIKVSSLLRTVPNVTGKIFDLPCTWWPSGKIREYAIVIVQKPRVLDTPCRTLRKLVYLNVILQVYDITQVLSGHGLSADHLVRGSYGQWTKTDDDHSEWVGGPFWSSAQQSIHQSTSQSTKCPTPENKNFKWSQIEAITRREI